MSPEQLRACAAQLRQAADEFEYHAANPTYRAPARGLPPWLVTVLTVLKTILNTIPLS